MSTPDIISIIGLVTLMCLLFKTNRGDIKDNKKNIAELFRCHHALDKKVSIILAVHELTEKSIYKKAVEKVNGDTESKET